MTKPKSKVFAVHPGEILKSEFMEPLGVSAYALAKALDFPGVYEIVRGDRAISADTAVRLGKYFGLPAQFWLNLQNDYDLRVAEGSGVGKKIKPRAASEAGQAPPAPLAPAIDLMTALRESLARHRHGDSSSTRTRRHRAG
ncbi:MAG: HigA family addiction module antitoxin [Terriglobales bacterium]